LENCWKNFPKCYKCSALKIALWYNVPPLHRKQHFILKIKGKMITIPLNTNTGIRILPKQAEPEKPKEGRAEKATPRIAVSVLEAAKMLGISKPHFLPLVKTGKIRTIRIGRRILVSVQSLRDFIDGTAAPDNSPEKNAELQSEK